MTQYTFELQQDLTVPATGNPNKGYLYFPKSLFGLSYEVRPQPKKKQLSVLLGVAELATGDIFWPLTIYDITEAGFPTDKYENQAEYDTYIATRTALENEMNTLASELDVITAAQDLVEDETSQEYLDLQAANKAKRAELDAKILEIAELPEVHRQTLYINKHDDVIDYFKGDGSLTDEGITWAKTVYYEGIQLGNIVV